MSLSAEGVVIKCESSDHFNEQLEKHKESAKLLVVKFTATWCGPCRTIAPFFAELANTMPHVGFLKVDVDELMDVTQEYSVTAMPTFLFFKDGKVIDKLVGPSTSNLRACILKNATA